MRHNRQGSRVRGIGMVLGLVAVVIGSAAANSLGAPRGSGSVSAVAVAHAAQATPTLSTGNQAPAGVTTGPIPHISPHTLRASQVITLPSARRCVTHVRVRFARPDGLRFRSVKTRLARRLITVSRNARSFNLTQLPKGAFDVRVRVITTTARQFVRSRRYRTC